MQWFLLGLVILVVGVVLWGVMDATGGASARTVWNSTWRDDDRTLLGGYLVTPVQARRVVTRPATGTPAPAIPSRDGRYPGVLLLHEWWGLNKEMTRLAEQIAADGYVVLAPDALRGRLAVSVPGALVQTMISPRRRIESDLDRALHELRSHPEVDPERIALVGFCFGGTQAMRLGVRTTRIAATAIFYGGGPITEPDEIGRLGSDGPVLGVYGGKDRTIALDAVRAFETALRASDVETEFHVFEDQGHAFVNSTSIRRRGDAAEAWDILRRFLRREA